MSTTVANKLDAVKVRPVKCDFRPTKESFVRQGAMVIQARERRGWSHEKLAQEMGISASLLSRQIENEDNQHVSWQRLKSVDDDEFQWRLIEVQLEAVRGVEMETRITRRPRMLKKLLPCDDVEEAV
jgi:AraC-like DNA-binding protein